MQRLRMKLEDDPSHPQHLVTVGRRGYRFGAASGSREQETLTLR
jgi:DNA-binding response OmpR family regulator